MNQPLYGNTLKIKKKNTMESLKLNLKVRKLKIQVLFSYDILYDHKIRDLQEISTLTSFVKTELLPKESDHLFRGTLKAKVL